MNQSARTFTASRVPRRAVQGPRRRGPVLWRVVLLALILGLAGGFVLARFLLYDRINDQYAQLKAQLDSTAARASATASRLQAALDNAQGRLAVEQSTRKALESSLDAVQNQLGKARDQLAFFHQLFPPGPLGSVNIRAFDVREQNGVLLYKVLLSRNVSDDSVFKGALQFQAEGIASGKKVKIVLQPKQVSAASGTGGDSSRLALSFDQFQRREGELALPEGFVPEAVTLDVLQGDTVRVSRTVKLS